MGERGTFSRAGERAAVSRRDSMKLGGLSLAGLFLGGAAAGQTVGNTPAASQGSTPTGGPDRIRQFASWAADLELGDVPADVVEKTELQIGNVLAAGLAGRASRDIDVPVTGTGATVIGGEEANLHDAVFANATYAIRNDYDSYLFAGHSEYGSVLPALALCELHGLGAAEFVENVVVANELAGRLGASVLIGPNNGQLVIFIHAAAAATVAARITDGSVEAIDNAVRLALYAPNNPLWAGLFDGDAKWFTAAIPATSGTRLGQMAAGGAIGASRALPNLHANESFLPFPEFVEAWGDTWVSRSLGFKPHPGDAYLLSPLEAFGQIMDEEDLDPDDVERVEAEVPLLASAAGDLNEQFASQERLDPIAVNYSVKNTLAMRAVEGDVRASMMTRENLNAIEDDLRAFAEKVEVEHEWSQTTAMVDALASGIDVTPLFWDRGIIETIKAVAEIDQTYHLDSTYEAYQLLASKEADDLLTAFGKLGWDEFDMAKADFDEVNLSFGAHVSVITESGGWWSADESYERSRETHSGASARPEAEKRAVVKEKFERQFGDHFDVIDDLHAGDLDELVGLL